MSGVALRCPNCGTTRGAAGECEACHEAQVRYYCTNHTPGRWLDGAACGACGARFGVAAPAKRPPVAALPARPPVSSTPPAPTPIAAPPPAPRPRRPAPGGSRTGGTAAPRTPAWPSPSPSPPAATGRPRGMGDDDFPAAARSPGWRELLQAVVEAQRKRRSAADGMAREAPVSRRRGGGCLSRLLMSFVFFVLAMLGMSMLGTGFLRMFIPY